MKNQQKPDKKSRRKFLKNSLTFGVGTLAGTGILSSCSGGKMADKGEKMNAMTADGKLVEIEADHMRHHMQPITNEEARKGDPDKEYVMVIDLAKCRNARKCVESCQGMHYLPSDYEWIKIFLMKDGEDTAPYWFPKPCFHCNSPSCVNVCPVGATYKRLDGLVLIDNNRCIGCKFCMAACPYSSRVFNWKQPPIPKEKEGIQDSPETSIPQKVGTVGKCDFCPDMARMGKLPMCVTSCPNGVLYFGDKKEDVVTNGVETVRFTDIVYERAGYRYMEELGTRPSTYYLPPVNRSFNPDVGLKDLSEKDKEKYNINRSKIKKETR